MKTQLILGTQVPSTGPNPAQWPWARSCCPRRKQSQAAARAPADLRLWPKNGHLGPRCADGGGPDYGSILGPTHEATVGGCIAIGVPGGVLRRTSILCAARRLAVHSMSLKRVNCYSCRKYQ